MVDQPEGLGDLGKGSRYNSVHYRKSMSWEKILGISSVEKFCEDF